MIDYFAHFARFKKGKALWIVIGVATLFNWSDLARGPEQQLI